MAVLTFDGTSSRLAVRLTQIGVATACLVEARAKWQFREPTFDSERLHLDYGLGIPRLPQNLDTVPWWLWVGGALLLLTGCGPRLGAASAAFGLTLFLTADQQNYSNHGYLMILTLAILGLVRSSGGDRVERWTVQVLRIQISIVYFFAAIQKIRPISLRGETIDYRLNGIVGARLPDFEWLAPLFNLSAFAAEVFLVVGLWSHRFRWPAAIVGVMFHLATLMLLTNALGLVAFAVLSVSFYPLFLVGQDRDGAAKPTPRLS